MAKFWGKVGLGRGVRVFPKLQPLDFMANEKRDVSLADGVAWFKMLGVNLDDIEVSDNAALGMSAFYSCVDLISNSVATPTWKVYEEFTNGDKNVSKTHPNFQLIYSRPDRHTSSFVFRKTLMIHVLIYGNAVVEIVMGKNNRPASFKLLKPSDYTFLDTDDRLLVQKKNGQVLQEEDYIHIKDLSLDGKIGISKIGLTKKGLKTQLTAEAFLSKYYEKGTFTNGYLKVSTKPDNGTLRSISETWDEQYGGIGSAYKTPTLPLGTEYIPLTKSNVESQLMEFLQYSPQRIYQTFRVPPHLVSDMDKSTSFGKGIEDLSILYLTHTLLPWVTQLEQEFNYKAFRASEYGRFYTKINLRSLERANFADQMEGFSKAIQAGIYSPNEVRTLLDVNNYVAGDVYMVNGNMISVDYVKENGGNVSQKVVK